jgi:4-diphosphocytidyl-2-C-methyl-D-erythritol kinase
MLQVQAHAKINLGLRIIGKRADGYHDLETIFQEISLCDELTFLPHAGEIRLHSDHPGCPSDHRNLIYKAAVLLQNHTRTGNGADITIRKHIPVGAGLGGGSSDAAATLKALNEMWQLSLPETDLLQLAAQLGADVAFFIRGGSALGTGKGDQLCPIIMPHEYWGVLIYPGFAVSTPWVYQNLNLHLTKSQKNSKLYGLSDYINDPGSWQAVMVNDLEDVVFEKFPELDHLRKQLATAGAFYSRMSGSGSSIFGLYTTRARAEEVFLGVGTSYQRFIFSPTPTLRNER